MKKISLKKTAVSLSLATLLLASGPLLADRITAGDAHNLVARGDGGQFVWGSDANGQLGDGLTLDALNPIAVTDIRYNALGGAVAVVAQGNNNIVVLDDATLLGWGPNENLQLGSGVLNSGKFLGETGDSTDPEQPIEVDKTLVFPTEIVDPDGKPIANITDIAMGSNFTAAVNQSGNVLVWGQLNAFQDREVSREPVNRFRDKFFDPTITFTDSRYFNGEPATDYKLQYMTDELGNRYTGIIAVAAGDDYVLALTNTGSVLAWGENGSGQLGDGTLAQRAYPVYVLNRQQIAISNIGDIAARGSTSVAVSYDGRVLGWGSSTVVSSTDATSTDATDTTSTTDSATEGSYADGLLDNAGNAITNIQRVALGDSHMLGLTKSGRVNGWGSNSNGQLGDGSNASITGTATVVLSNGQPLSNIIEIAVGSTHSMALQADGQVFTWGSGENGRLGDGTNVDSYYAVNVRNQYNGVFSLFGY